MSDADNNLLEDPIGSIFGPDADLNEVQQLIAALPRKQQRHFGEMLAKAEILRSKRLARTNFLDFVRYVWPGFIAGNHHKIMANAFDRVVSGECKRLIICMPPRHTKALALDTPILTPSGWTTMAALQVGDFVFGADGHPTMVVGKSEVFRDRPCWTVTTDDGASVVCDDDHLWNVRLCRKRPVFHNKTAAHLGARQVSMTEGRKPMLPDMPVVQFPEADLPVDPYLFGVWLGDGATLQATITMHEDDQPVVRARIEAAGYATKDRTTKMTFGVDGLKVLLREMGVLGNKHIPAIYMRASATQRAALLDGLMDTDGNVTKGRQCFLATSSETLANQYLELIRSLGYKASLLRSRAILDGRDYGETYRIGFYATDICTLPRKRERAMGRIKPTGRYISLERAPNQDTVCIKVAAQDGLFLAGDGLVVTHNSEFASIHFPAYFLGRYPNKKVMMSSHTSELAVGFGRKVRNIVNSTEYRELFPTTIAGDNKAAGRWATDDGGELFALGVGGMLSGRGGDVVVIDDAHSEGQGAMAMTNPEVLEPTFDWFTSGPRQRLQPGGAMIIVGTRWHASDLIGRVLEQSAKSPKGQQWEVIEFPAILPSGRALWPQYWPLSELEAIKAEIPAYKWNAQYLQRPGGSEVAIIKRDYWKQWTKPDPPEIEVVMSAFDTAFTKEKRSNYSACVVFGVFYRTVVKSNGDEEHIPNVILLDAWKKRLDFPDLKREMLEHYKERRPDIFMIENRATGSPLIQEFREMGLTVSEFTPARGMGKVARVNAVVDIFASGRVWAPDTSWADDVIAQCEQFPFGAEDDLVDCVSMALLRLREGGLVSTNRDNAALTDEEKEFRPRRRAYY